MQRSIVNTPLRYQMACPLPVTSTGDKSVLRKRYLNRSLSLGGNKVIKIAIKIEY